MKRITLVQKGEKNEDNEQDHFNERQESYAVIFHKYLAKAQA
jgi:hypothetical protein